MTSDRPSTRTPCSKANAEGVILGYDGKVRPTDNITREDATVMLGRAAGD